MPELGSTALPGEHGAQDPVGWGAQRRQKEATPPCTLVTLMLYSLATSLVNRRPWHREHHHHLPPTPHQTLQSGGPPAPSKQGPPSLTASW